MLVVVVGNTFHGTLAEAPVDKTPKKEAPSVSPGADAALPYLRDRADKVPFRVMVPTVIARGSWIDSERPVAHVLDRRGRAQAQDDPARHTAWAPASTGASR